MKLAIPVVLTQMSITAMQIVDSAMVGRLGAPQLASIGLGGIWLWTLLCFFVGTTTCIQTFVAQHHGAEEYRECGSWAWQGLHALVPIAVAMSFVIYFGAETLLVWIAPDPEITPYALDYLRMRAFGNVGLIGAVALSSFFRGLGDTRTPLYASVAANLLNALLDYGLIFGNFGLPAWGVAGAGVATSIAEWANFLFLGIFFFRFAGVEQYQTRFARPSLDRIRRLMRTGLPVGGQWWLEMTSFAAFMTLVARMGDAPMAASQAFIALLAVSFMQAQGLGIAVSTLVGRYIGARDLDSAERSFSSGIQVCLMFTGSIAVVYLVFPEPLLRIFSDDVRVIELGVPLLWVGSVFQVFDAVAIIADGGLRGAGDTRWPMIVRFLLAWGIFLPAAYILGFVLGGGLTWAWGGGVIYIAVLSAVMLLRIRSGVWKTIRI